MTDKPMTDREKKEFVAGQLLSQAGNLVEFWSEMARNYGHDREAEEIDAEYARACIARWLRRLPGDIWDTRLDPPNR
jgi:hypothetical protein